MLPILNIMHDNLEHSYRVEVRYQDTLLISPYIESMLLTILFEDSLPGMFSEWLDA